MANLSADEHGAFERFSDRMQAIREVGAIAKAGEWEQIETLAQANTTLWCDAVLKKTQPNTSSDC